MLSHSLSCSMTLDTYTHPHTHTHAEKAKLTLVQKGVVQPLACHELCNKTCVRKTVGGSVVSQIN